MTIGVDPARGAGQGPIPTGTQLDSRRDVGLFLPIGSRIRRGSGRWPPRDRRLAPISDVAMPVIGVASRSIQV